MKLDPELAAKLICPIHLKPLVVHCPTCIATSSRANKRQTGERKGRPKGSKNKPNTQPPIVIIGKQGTTPAFVATHDERELIKKIKSVLHEKVVPGSKAAINRAQTIASLATALALMRSREMEKRE